MAIRKPVQIDLETWKKLKIVAMRENKTMNDVLALLVNDRWEKGNKERRLPNSIVEGTL
jgi:macrodomain Ter protein organizer (MatP/YcbG family)